MGNAQHAPSPDQSNDMPATVTLSVTQFSAFKNFLNIIKSHFNDFSLIDGAFRAWSNNHLYLVETGFPFLRGMRFDIANIKEKFKILSMFKKRTDITFTVNNTEFTITDGITPLTFVKPNPAFLDNKYFSDNEIEEFFKTLEPNRKIVDAIIPTKYVSRAKQLSLKTLTDYFHLKHNKTDLNNGCFFIPNTSDKSVEVSINFNVNFQIPMIKDHFIQLPTFPFNFDKDVLYLKCYFNPDQTITTMYSTKINNLFVNMYSKSALFQEGVDK